MVEERPGWKIQGTFYPHVGASGLRHGDFTLIREVTGLTTDQFDRGDDAVATETGWIAVALWHGNPELRREQVVRLMEALPHDGAEQVGWAPQVGDDASPPAQDEPASSAGSSTTSDASPEARDGSESESPEASTPEPSTQNSSGHQESDTGAASARTTSDRSLSVAG